MVVPWTVKRVTQIVWESQSCFRRVGSEAVAGPHLGILEKCRVVSETEIKAREMGLQVI